MELDFMYVNFLVRNSNIYIYIYIYESVTVVYILDWIAPVFSWYLDFGPESLKTKIKTQCFPIGRPYEGFMNKCVHV